MAGGLWRGCLGCPERLRTVIPAASPRRLIKVTIRPDQKESSTGSRRWRVIQITSSGRIETEYGGSALQEYGLHCSLLELILNRLGVFINFRDIACHRLS
jgi:hypothetical protein